MKNFGKWLFIFLLSIFLLKNLAFCNIAVDPEITGVNICGVGYSFPNSVLYLNPASLVDKKERYFTTGTYSTVFDLAKLNFFEYNFGKFKKYFFNLGLSEIKYNEFSLDGYTWSDSFVILSYAFKKSPFSSYGLKLNYKLTYIPNVYDNIRREEQGFSLDAGGLYKIDKTLSCGFILKNIISSHKSSLGTYERQETEFIVGLSEKIFNNNIMLLDISNIINFRNSKPPTSPPTIISFGIERAFENIILRSYYSTENKFSAGITFISFPWEINYLYQPDTKIKEINKSHFHKISISTKF